LYRLTNVSFESVRTNAIPDTETPAGRIGGGSVFDEVTGGARLEVTRQ
jgi:hypothetical protein